MQKLNELASGGQVSKTELEDLQQLLQQSAMLGLPIEAIMNQFNTGVAGPPPAASAMGQLQVGVPEERKTPKPEKKVKQESNPAQPNITKEQQQKLLALEKQLQDPTMQMLMAQGLINPATLCGLDNETAKLLGLAPPTSNKQNHAQLDVKSLMSQPGMTPDMLALMQMQLGQPGMPNMGQTQPQQPSKKIKKRQAPNDFGQKQESNSRPASRSSIASSHNARQSASEPKKRKSDEKVDINTLPNNMKIPLIMSDGTRVPDGVSNKELKGLLDSNPQIKVKIYFIILLGQNISRFF